jgi:hypothetical protein
MSQALAVAPPSARSSVSACPDADSIARTASSVW